MDAEVGEPGVVTAGTGGSSDSKEGSSTKPLLTSFGTRVDDLKEWSDMSSMHPDSAVV